MRCLSGSFKYFFLWGEEFSHIHLATAALVGAWHVPGGDCKPGNRQQHAVHRKVCAENVQNPTCYSEFYSVSMKWLFTNAKIYSAVAVMF